MKKYTVLCSIIAVILLLFLTVGATSEEVLLERTETNSKIVTEEGYMTINRVGISNGKVEISISVNAQEFELSVSGEQKTILESENGVFYLSFDQTYVAYLRVFESDETLHTYLKFSLDDVGGLAVRESVLQHERKNGVAPNATASSSGTIYESENNGSMETANRTYHDKDNYGTISSMDDEDWWVVSFDFDGVAAFWLGNIPAGSDYDLALWDDTGTAKKYSSNTGTVAEYFTYEVEADRDYYIQVTGWEGSNNPNSEYWLRTRINPVVSTSVTLHQQEEKDTCGSACGVMILNSLGVNVTEKTFTSWNQDAHDDRADEFTFVYAVCDTINHFLTQVRKTVRYRYVKTRSESDDEKMFMIAESLTAGCPIAIPLTIQSDAYFPYASTGHYVVVGGLTYDASTSKVMAVVYDSHDKYCAIRTVPLEVEFKYSEANSSYVICT